MLAVRQRVLYGLKAAHVRTPLSRLEDYELVSYDPHNCAALRQCLERHREAMQQLHALDGRNLLSVPPVIEPLIDPVEVVLEVGLSVGDGHFFEGPTGLHHEEQELLDIVFEVISNSFIDRVLHDLELVLEGLLLE